MKSAIRQTLNKQVDRLDNVLKSRISVLEITLPIYLQENVAPVLIQEPYKIAGIRLDVGLIRIKKNLSAFGRRWIMYCVERLPVRFSHIRIQTFLDLGEMLLVPAAFR